jgi:hypothetical protein
MNIPGFTAEASLYVTHEKYRQLKVDDASSQGRQIISQSFSIGCCNAGSFGRITVRDRPFLGWCHIDFFSDLACSGLWDCAGMATYLQQTGQCVNWD